MIRNLIAFRSLKRSWRYCLEDTLKDIQFAFDESIKAGQQTVDILFMSYDTEDFTEEDRTYIEGLIDTKLYQLFWTTVPEPHVKVGGYLTIGYGGWRVNRWKCSQEVASGLAYDRVIETRYDTLRRNMDPAWTAIVDLIPQEFHIYMDRRSYVDGSQLPVILNDFTVVTSGSTHDIWGYSYMKNGPSMLKLASLVDLTSGFNSRFGAGEGWGVVLRKSGLIPDYHQIEVPIILRVEQFGYEPIIYSNSLGGLDLLAPVNPTEHFSHSKLYKERIGASFAKDTIPFELLSCPAFIVQAMMFSRIDLDWPNQFTLLVEPEEKSIIEDFIEAAGLAKYFTTTIEVPSDKPVALLSGSDILSAQFHRTFLRFEPVNNIEKPGKKADVIFIGGQGEPRGAGDALIYSQDAKTAFLFFGSTTIWDAEETPTSSHISYWSGTALIKNTEKMFPRGITVQHIEDLAVQTIPNRGLINYPQQGNDPAWKVYKNTIHRFHFYTVNSRTILYVRDSEQAEDIFALLLQVIPEASVHGNFCSWSYEPKKRLGQEQTIKQFVEAVIA